MVKQVQYNREKHYELVNDFLEETYIAGGYYQNWLRARWEYMHFHPYLDIDSLDKIALWFENDKLLSLVHYEDTLGCTYFECHPDKKYSFLKREMLDYAEKNLRGINENKVPYIYCFINEFDKEFSNYAKDMGFKINKEYQESITRLDNMIKIPKLPNGYKIISISDGIDYNKFSKCMWYGFNHEGEIPSDDVESRIKMHKTPRFNKDLYIIIVSDNGDYASTCGMWYDEKTKVAMVEPVCTHPDYRRKKLGTIAVLEGARRCIELGAKEIFVESGQEFYKSMGFVHKFNKKCGLKYLNKKEN